MIKSGLAGWANKLRGICDDDEGRDRLENVVKAVFEREIQQSQCKTNERWIFEGGNVKNDCFFFGIYFD